MVNAGDMSWCGVVEVVVNAGVIYRRTVVEDDKVK